MKTLFKIVLLFFFPLMCVSCGDDKDEPDMPSKDENKTEAVYYVKYEASVSSRYSSKGITYTVSTDNGGKIFATDEYVFSETFGPVKKGFKAKLLADASALSQAECFVKIYVCRETGPFALKASASGDKTASTSYVIDF